MIEIVLSEEVRDLMLGVVQAHELSIGESGKLLRDACAGVVQRVQAAGMSGGEPRREAVRRLLRAGGFKPAGRNKPAQEYLLKTALESQGLPAIWNAVDLLNMVSLESGLPISLLALSRFARETTTSDVARVVIRYGNPGEKFVFNRAGQELELEGLICVCSDVHGASIALGTPIKDSMAGKISEQDRDVLAFIYAPRSAVGDDELLTWCNALGKGFVDHCSAASFQVSTHSS